MRTLRCRLHLYLNPVTPPRALPPRCSRHQTPAPPPAHSATQTPRRRRGLITPRPPGLHRPPLESRLDPRSLRDPTRGAQTTRGTPRPPFPALRRLAELGTAARPLHRRSSLCTSPAHCAEVKAPRTPSTPLFPLRPARNHTPAGLRPNNAARCCCEPRQSPHAPPSSPR